MSQRIKNFVDDFIRSRYVNEWTEEKDKDFINEPERAKYEQAEAAVVSELFNPGGRKVEVN